MKRTTAVILFAVAAIMAVFMFYPLGYVFRQAFFPEGSFALAILPAADQNRLNVKPA